jgi:hypothetical protein
MNIYEHFAKQTRLPVRLKDVKEFILNKGVVSEIIRFPIETNQGILVGVFQKYYDLAPPYQERPLIVRIGYPKNASDAVQRLVTVKEMLHAVDPKEATSPRKDDVERFICDLLVEEAEKEIGLAARVDHAKHLNALCVLLPRAALDIIRPSYKAGAISVEQVAQEARLPKSYAAAALTDEWRQMIEQIA